MRVFMIVVFTIAAAWLAATWKAAMLTEEEEQTISVGLKNIGNSLRRRSCIYEAETLGLNQINSVLTKHGSGHRIVFWDLPDRTCKE
jgi:hypothetical protein